MDIRVKRTNRIFWEVSPETATILLEVFPDEVERLHLSFHEKQDMKAALKPVPAAVLTPTFDVVHDRVAGKYRLRLTCGSVEEFYTGPPIHAAAAFGGGNRTPPQSVINEYALFVGDGKPVDPLIELERRRKAAQPQQPGWPRYE